MKSMKFVIYRATNNKYIAKACLAWCMAVNAARLTFTAKADST
jgi:hypothetical protein